MLETRGRGPQAIILAPTRELVQQIVVELQKLAEGQPVAVCGIFGGEPIDRQIRALADGRRPRRRHPRPRPGPHRAATRSTSGDIVHVVLDEADRMLDIGFRPDIERILRKLPDAAADDAALGDDQRRRPEAGPALHVRAASRSTCRATSPRSRRSSSTTSRSDAERKFDLLVHLLQRDRPRQCIVFTRTKRGADRLADRLRGAIHGVAAIHGDLPQTTRDRVMRGFRSGQITVLVATDVVGRGIDVEDISHVINYDIPDDPENYVHRIGRTGRMGKDGIAYLFVCPDQGEPLTAIENLINKIVTPMRVDGFEPSRAARLQPAARELFNNITGPRAAALAVR